MIAFMFMAKLFERLQFKLFLSLFALKTIAVCEKKKHLVLTATNARGHQIFHIHIKYRQYHQLFNDFDNKHSLTQLNSIYLNLMDNKKLLEK